MAERRSRYGKHCLRQRNGAATLHRRAGGGAMDGGSKTMCVVKACDIEYVMLKEDVYLS